MYYCYYCIAGCGLNLVRQAPTSSRATPPVSASRVTATGAMATYCFVGAGFTVVSHPFLSPRSKPGGRGSSHPFRCPLSHPGGVLPPSQPCLCPGLLQPGGDGSLCGVPGVDDGSAVGPPCGTPPPPLPPPLASALDAYESTAAANAAATSGAIVIALVP